MIYSNFRMGGKLCEIPKPWKRWFDDKRRVRRVRIYINRFPGFPHYYVSIEQEDNPIWRAEDKTWQLAWDDTEGHGLKFMLEKFSTTQAATKYIQNILDKHFQKHKPVYKHSDCRWDPDRPTR